MFFQNGTNLNKLRKNKEAVLKLTEGKSELEKVDLLLENIESMYGEYPEIRKFFVYCFSDFWTKYEFSYDPAPAISPPFRSFMFLSLLNILAF